MAARVTAVTLRKLKSSTLTLQALRRQARHPEEHRPSEEGVRSAASGIRCARTAGPRSAEEAVFRLVRVGSELSACGFRKVRRSVEGSIGGNSLGSVARRHRPSFARRDRTASPSAGTSRSKRCASAMIDWFL